VTQCSEISPLLGAFEDGELEPHEMQEVARHLARCQMCEKVLASYATVGRLLRDTVAIPTLDAFGEAVHARLEHLRPPLITRIGRWFDSLGERFGTAAGFAVAMATAAVLTIVLATPLVRDMNGANRQDITMASRESIGPDINASSPATLAAAGSEPGTVISRLETSNPDVAVWSEPSQDTTVIWLPDQQP
jgi:anti-sigma factor RsiW